MTEKPRLILVGEGKPAETAAKAILAHDNTELVGLFTDMNRKSHLLRMCGEHGVKIYRYSVLQSHEGLVLIRGLSPDWLVSSNSTVILDSSVLDVPTCGCVNIHPGILPQYAGLHTHQWAIREGLEKFGVSVHFMTANIDAGDIISIKNYSIAPTATGLQIFLKALKTMSESVCELIELIANKQSLPRLPQDISQRRLFRHRDALDGRIDWKWSAEKIRNFVRAGNYLPMTSPSYTAFIEGYANQTDSIYLYEVFRVPGNYESHPGRILSPANEGLTVHCGEGEALCINHARYKGKVVQPDDWKTYLKDRSDLRLPGRP